MVVHAGLSRDYPTAQHRKSGFPRSNCFSHRTMDPKAIAGGILALRAHCALLVDYVPPEEPLGTPLGNTLRIRRPKLDK